MHSCKYEHGILRVIEGSYVHGLDLSYNLDIILNISSNWILRNKIHMYYWYDDLLLFLLQCTTGQLGLQLPYKHHHCKLQCMFFKRYILPIYIFKNVHQDVELVNVIQSLWNKYMYLLWFLKIKIRFCVLRSDNRFLNFL